MVELLELSWSPSVSVAVAATGCAGADVCSGGCGGGVVVTLEILIEIVLSCNARPQLCAAVDNYW